MSTKRTRDQQHEMTGRAIGDAQATARILQSVSPAARIDRLRRHKALRAKADELAKWYEESGRCAPAALLSAISSAEQQALSLDAAPKVIRDNLRQAGTRKGRRSRMPKLDAWLDLQDLDLLNDELFELLPTSESDSDFYRDKIGDAVTEIGSSGKEHSITRAGFYKRVTSARKRR